MKYRKILIIGALTASLLILAGCSDKADNMGDMDHSNMNMGQNHVERSDSGESNMNGKDSAEGMLSNVPIEVLTDTKITLTAQTSHLMVNDTNMRTAYTFNGTVPGPQIRAQLGDDMEITLKNELDVPTTIHWHGLPVPNNMDGIPGVTMNAIQPGESFTYKFKANVPGTYWYHSHQDGVVQVDKGLYGSFIVEDPNEKKPDRDYTVVLDEWMEDGEMDHSMMDMSSMDMGSMDHGSMDHGSMKSADHNMQSPEGMMSDAEMMPMMYTIFTANGKSGDSIEPLIVKEGQTVRIRLINAGFLSHPIYLQGHEFKIVSTDGVNTNLKLPKISN